ncbi:hypothetical protein WN51_10328 [Melipona quadrifasciata]|uniref:Uncharacterized protein n=1 Tax=Melipona quadrifasciata TaxID=166423 RepID=A0A0M9A6Z9_9HYME|nr:hypothetical protein WN51_10328 [Melipona quadrifasciata]
MCHKNCAKCITVIVFIEESQKEKKRKVRSLKNYQLWNEQSQDDEGLARQYAASLLKFYELFPFVTSPSTDERLNLHEEAKLVQKVKGSAPLGAFSNYTARKNWRMFQNEYENEAFDQQTASCFSKNCTTKQRKFVENLRQFNTNFRGQSHAELSDVKINDEVKRKHAAKRSKLSRQKIFESPKDKFLKECLCDIFGTIGANFTAETEECRQFSESESDIEDLLADTKSKYYLHIDLTLVVLSRSSLRDSFNLQASRVGWRVSKTIM